MCLLAGRPQHMPGVPAVLGLLGHRVGGQHLGDPGAVGIGHQVAVLVGVGIHVRGGLLQPSVLGGAGQVEDQREWTAGSGGRWHVQSVVAGQSPESEGEHVGTGLRRQPGPGVAAGCRRTRGRGRGQGRGHCRGREHGRGGDRQEPARPTPTGSGGAGRRASRWRCHHSAASASASARVGWTSMDSTMSATRSLPVTATASTEMSSDAFSAHDGPAQDDAGGRDR